MGDCFFITLPREVQCNKHSLVPSQCRGIGNWMRAAHRLKGEKVKEIINNKGDDCPVVINVKCFRE